MIGAEQVVRLRRREAPTSESLLRRKRLQPSRHQSPQALAGAAGVTSAEACMAIALCAYW
jgi:hypothetical protein